MSDGGTAFPVSRAYFTKDGSLRSVDWLDGMSLLDWFAGQALPSLITLVVRLHTSPVHGRPATDLADIKHAVAIAYQAAEVMLAEREKRRPV